MDTLIKIVAIAVIMVLVPFIVLADETSEQVVVIASFAFIDYNQSVDMFFRSEGYHEMNPILGPSPSRGDMLAFGAIGVGLSYVIAEIIPDPWKRIVIDSIIATERFNIEENRRVYHGWNTEGPPLLGRSLDIIPIVLSFRF